MKERKREIFIFNVQSSGSDDAAGHEVVPAAGRARSLLRDADWHQRVLIEQGSHCAVPSLSSDGYGFATTAARGLARPTEPVK